MAITFLQYEPTHPSNWRCSSPDRTHPKLLRWRDLKQPKQRKPSTVPLKKSVKYLEKSRPRGDNIFSTVTFNIQYILRINFFHYTYFHPFYAAKGFGTALKYRFLYVCMYIRISYDNKADLFTRIFNRETKGVVESPAKKMMTQFLLKSL